MGLEKTFAAVQKDSEHNKTRKIMVITFSREHWEIFNRMLEAAQGYMPGLDEQGLASAIIASALREQEEKQIRAIEP